jgi:hypothetical protein
MIVANDATVKGGSYYPMTVSDMLSSTTQLIFFIYFTDIGEEAFACAGNSTGARFALCISWYVLRVYELNLSQTVDSWTVESGGAALPHQANVG